MDSPTYDVSSKIISGGTLFRFAVAVLIVAITWMWIYADNTQGYINDLLSGSEPQSTNSTPIPTQKQSDPADANYVSQHNESEFEQLINRSSEKFNFKIEDGTDTITHEDQINFIRANFQRNYELVQSRYAKPLPFKTAVHITDSIDRYEKEFGFKYSTPPARAAFTRNSSTYILMENSRNSSFHYELMSFVLRNEVIELYKQSYRGTENPDDSSLLWFDQGVIGYLSDPDGELTSIISDADPTTHPSNLEDLNIDFYSSNSVEVEAAYSASREFIAWLVDQSSEGLVLDLHTTSELSLEDLNRILGFQFEENADELYVRWYNAQ